MLAVPVTVDSEASIAKAGQRADRSTPRVPARAVLAILAGACIHVYLQVQMLLTLPGFSFHRFKMFYALDQMSYLGIALNVAQGRSGSTEPFTEAGVSHYPRLYYVVMGLLSRVSGVDTVVVWWLMGLTLQFVLACFIGWALYITTRHWWSGLLAPVPFLIGTFAGVLNGSYRIKIPSGGSMWGPFALLFPLNGGTAGVSLASCAVLGLLIAGWGGFRPRPTMVAGIFAAICLGIVGNMQTYSFIGLCYVLIYSTAFYGLQSPPARHRWVLPLTSAATLLTILSVGGSVAAQIGPLLVLVLGLLPALPGYLVVCRLTSWRLLWVTLLGVVLALPTTVGTLQAVAQKDPFLLYRQASTAVNGHLGIPVMNFFLYGAVAILLLLILALVPHTKSKLTRSYVLGALLAWSLLSFNDHWGPDQEPYRFWIDEFMLVLVTGFPLLAAVAADAVRQVRLRQHTVVATLTALSVAIWAVAATVSAKDWLIFNHVARAAGVSWWPSPRSAAIASLMADMPQGAIVTSDTCTDPKSVKLISGGRVAFYNMGLAWPNNHVLFSRLAVQRDKGELDNSVALKIGVSYLLTDSHCTMPLNPTGTLQPIGSSTYVDEHGKSAGLRLWKIIA